MTSPTDHLRQILSMLPDIVLNGGSRSVFLVISTPCYSCVISTVNIWRSFQSAAAEQPPQLRSYHRCQEESTLTLKNTRKISSFPSGAAGAPLNKRIEEVPGNGKICFLALSAESLG